ncbi:MAG: FAD-dependent oxidoreductase, partial [Bacillota bacterium]|nr:FAD-dependent oxidoreductase [Bacillota bacterium]
MSKIYDIIIIGGGTAGMTAAIYGHRAGRSVLVIEKSFLGGQIISTSEIENYPGLASATGYDFAGSLQEQLDRFGIEHVSDEVTGLESAPLSSRESGDTGKGQKKYWRALCLKDVYVGKSIIIATGTESRKLGLEREDEFLGKGVSYCATCDGLFF